MIFNLFLIAFIPLCLLGGWFARMDGGGKPATPEIVERLLCISFFVAAVFSIEPWLSPVALLGMFGLATGHGQYFLSLVDKEIKPETMDFVVRLFFGNDPRTEDSALTVHSYGRDRLLRRCVFGMFVTGSLVGLPAALVALYSGRIMEACILASTGLVKAFAYYVTRPMTEPAELINGTLRTALALVVLGFSAFLIA